MGITTETVERFAFGLVTKLGRWALPVDALAELVEDVVLAMPFELRPLLLGPLVGLLEDVHIESAGAANLSFLPLLVAPVLVPCGGGQVVLCTIGATTSTQVTSALVAASMLLGSITIRRRHEAETSDPTVQHMAANVLLSSSGATLTLLLLDHFLPASFCNLAANPLVALRHMEDLVASPLWLVGLGSAAGRGPGDMLQTSSFAVLGAVGQIGAASAFTVAWQWSFLSFALMCIGVAAHQVTQRLPAHTKGLSESGQAHHRFCGEVLGLYWILGLTVQGLGLAHAVGVPQQMLEYSLLDILVKVGGCHLLTKRRWDLDGEHVMAVPAGLVLDVGLHEISDSSSVSSMPPFGGLPVSGCGDSDLQTGQTPGCGDSAETAEIVAPTVATSEVGAHDLLTEAAVGSSAAGGGAQAAFIAPGHADVAAPALDLDGLLEQTDTASTAYFTPTGGASVLSMAFKDPSNTDSDGGISHD